MRLSLRRAAHAALSSAAKQEIRVRCVRDDNSFGGFRVPHPKLLLQDLAKSSFRPEESWVFGPTQVDEKRFLFATTLHGCAALPFCHLDRSVPGFSATLHRTSRKWLAKRHQHQQEIRGSAVERSLCGRSGVEMFFGQERSVVERSAVSFLLFSRSLFIGNKAPGLKPNDYAGWMCGLKPHATKAQPHFIPVGRQRMRGFMEWRMGFMTPTGSTGDPGRDYEH